jgi:hypothetical protein
LIIKKIAGTILYEFILIGFILLGILQTEFNCQKKKSRDIPLSNSYKPEGYQAVKLIGFSKNEEKIITSAIDEYNKLYPHAFKETYPKIKEIEKISDNEMNNEGDRLEISQYSIDSEILPALIYLYLYGIIFEKETEEILNGLTKCEKLTLNSSRHICNMITSTDKMIIRQIAGLKNKKNKKNALMILYLYKFHKKRNHKFGIKSSKEFLDYILDQAQ